MDRDVKDRKHTENTDRTNLANNYKVFLHGILKEHDFLEGHSGVTGVAKPIRVAS